MASTEPAPDGVHRFSVVHFLLALVALLIALPFVDLLPHGDLIEASLLTLVLLLAVLTVGGRRQTLIGAAILVTPSVLGTWTNHFQSGAFPREVTLAATIVFVSFVILHLLGFILRSTRVDTNVMCAAVATYLLLALLWAFAYSLVERLSPNSFAFAPESYKPRVITRFEALYFSISTLTTAAYGDIVPVSNVARMLAMLEATTGVFFLALLVARLVSRFSRSEPLPSTADSDPSLVSTSDHEAAKA